jgi:iron(III) transport system permease protein
MALAWACLVAFVVLFVAYPLVRVALTPTAPDWVRVAASERWREAFVHSLTMMVLSTASSLAVGFAFAYAVTRVRIPGSKWISAIPLMHLLTPPFVGGLSFLLLFGRRGLITHQLLGLDWSIYGWHGLWLAQTLSFFPLAFLILNNSLMAIDAALEQAARGLGAGRWRVFRTVTLPLTAPGFGAAGLFIALGVLGDFGNPLLLGGRYRVLATEVYTQLGGWVEPGTAACLGLVLLVPSLVLFAIQQILERRTRRRFETVGNRGGGLELLGSGRVAGVALTVLCGLVSLLVVLQYCTIFLGAVSHVWGVDASWTGAHFGEVRRYGRELANTLRLSLLGAALCAVVSAFAAFAVHRAAVPLRRFIDLATLLPAALPGSLFGLALAVAFHGKPFALTGTAAILVAALVVKSLPEGYRIASASLTPLRLSLDEGARNLGASRLRMFGDVILPLTRRSVVAVFLFSFLQGVGTLSSVIFLVSFSTPLTSVAILNLADQGDWSGASALACVLVVITVATLGLLRWVSGRNLGRVIL